MGVGEASSGYYYSYQQVASSPFPYVGDLFDIPFRCADAQRLIAAGVAEWATEYHLFYGW